MGLLWPVLVALIAVASPSFAATEPKVIAWPDLMPKTILPEDLDFGGDSASADQSTDPGLGGIVQHGMTPALPGTIGPTDVVEELNDVEVKIAGYVLPLDFEATTVREFLLVPYVGACIHVPPPPPNQIIYVTSEDGVEVGGLFEPMWITGKLAISSFSNELADVGYTMTLNDSEPYEF